MSEKQRVDGQSNAGSPNDRRGFLVKLSAGMGALGLAWWLRPVKLHGAAAGAPEGELDPELRRFLGELRAGRRLDGRWTIERIRGRHLGAVAFLLRAPDGGRAQVDVLRRDADSPAPIAATRSLALYLSNRGKGAQPTDEEQGAAVMALGRALARREEAGHRAPKLLSFAERRARHPLGEYAIA